MVYSAVLRTSQMMGSNPHNCLWTRHLQVHELERLFAAVLISVQSAGVAPEVNLRITQSL